jgi:hypothetical protein
LFKAAGSVVERSAPLNGFESAPPVFVTSIDTVSVSPEVLPIVWPVITQLPIAKRFASINRYMLAKGFEPFSMQAPLQRRRSLYDE